MRRWLLVVLTGLLVVWAQDSAQAQTGIPNGVFVRESNSLVWLVLDGKLVAVPIWRETSDAEIRALPDSGKFAVMNDAGQIVAGEIPVWARQQPEPGRGSYLEGVEGQQAVAIGALSNEPFRATVKTMMTVRLLSSTKQAADAVALQYDDSWPAGIFVVVQADVENIGTKPACCIPRFRLRDARGRFFSGENSQGDQLVRQAMFWFHSEIKYESSDYQPNLPKRRVFVYDIPADATGLTLVSDR